MATASKAAKAAAEEEVPAGYRYIQAPLARSNEQPYIVGVNGVNYAIPQDGKLQLVPDFVAYEFERAQEAERTFFDTQDRLHAQAQIV